MQTSTRHIFHKLLLGNFQDKDICGFSLWVTFSWDFLSPPSILCLWQIAPALGTGDSGSLTGWSQLETKELSSQTNDLYKALTELVQLSAYRGSSHRRNVASSHMFHVPKVYLIAVDIQISSPFLGQYGARFTRCHFRAPQKVPIFRAHPV